MSVLIFSTKNKVTENKMSVLIFSTNFVSNISHSKNNSVTYHKCISVSRKVSVFLISF
jgi:hypothetical protein